MANQSRDFLFFVSVCLAVVSANCGAASLSAETQICNGFFGSAEAPRLNCGSGSAGGTGSVIIGGSGEGSGINVPFSADPYGGEFSASATALQDYGVFRAHAAIHVVQQSPGPYGGVYRAMAAGEFRDTWTITGGTGAGRFNLAFAIDGATSLTLVSVDGDPGASASATLSMSMSMAPQNQPSQGATLCCVTAAGTYVLLPGTGTGLNFIYGEPFNISVLTIVNAGGGFNRLNPPSFFQLDAVASFEHTAILSAILVTDLSGNPISNFAVSAASGTQFPIAATTVPLPAGYGLLLAGCCLARQLGRRRGVSGTDR